MEGRKEIKRQSYDLTVPDFFMLPSTNRLKGFDRYKHEQAAGDLFVTFNSFIEAWSFEPAIGKDRGDRGMIYQGKIIYFEVDRCTEGFGVIEEKIENYIRYARETRERFHVVFSLLESELVVMNRAKKMLELFEDKKRGNQFLVANHINLLEVPFDDILFSPTGEAYSFNSLQ